VLQYVVMCCSVLQCVVVCSIILQCVAVLCSSLKCVAVNCNVLQCVAVCCSMFHYFAVCCSMLQCAATVAVCCSVLQCAAVCFRVDNTNNIVDVIVFLHIHTDVYVYAYEHALWNILQLNTAHYSTLQNTTTTHCIFPAKYSGHLSSEDFMVWGGYD